MEAIMKMEKSTLLNFLLFCLNNVFAIVVDGTKVSVQYKNSSLI